MEAKFSQLNQKMEKLKSLTKELTKKINKGSDYSEQLARRYVRIYYAKQKHMGCKKVWGQSEATLQTGRRNQKV